MRIPGFGKPAPDDMANPKESSPLELVKFAQVPRGEAPFGIKWEVRNILVSSDRLAFTLSDYGKHGWEPWGVIEGVQQPDGKILFGIGIKRRVSDIEVATTMPTPSAIARP